MMYSSTKNDLISSEIEFREKADALLEKAKSQIDIETMSVRDITKTEGMIELARLVIKENQMFIRTIDCMMDQLAMIEKKLSDLENKG